MLKLTFILTLALLLSNCMTIKALETQFQTPARVKCFSEGAVIYDGVPSGVLEEGNLTYIEDRKTGQLIKTQANCTYYYGVSTLR